MMFPQPCNFTGLKKNISMTLSLLLLAGCAAKSDRYDVPLVPLPERYSNAPTAATVATSKNDPAIKPASSIALDKVLAEWWRILKNPELDVLLDRVIANNPDLRIATLRIAQTQARLVVAGSGKLPEISLPVRYEASGPVYGHGIATKGGSTMVPHSYEASLRGDWRPDLWGEFASLYESAEFQLWRATFQRDEIQRKLVANVVADYLEYLSLNDRLRVAHETDKVLSEMLESVATRLEDGDATVTEMEQQKAAVYAVRATIPVLEQQREVVTNRLAGMSGSLAGSIPGALKLSDNGLDSVIFPTVLPGVPSSYLLQRPDVRVVEARLLSADADIDVARARVLPPLDLTTQIGYGSLHLSQWFQPQSLAWNAIANLSATIFDNGKRSGEVKFARAIHEEMVETYIRVIYDAVREVEDSLSAIRLMNNRLEAQQTATDSSRRAWYFSQESYMAGAEDYLVALDTERTYHRNLDIWYNVRMERYRGLVDLFTALGGGAPRAGAIPGVGARPLPLTAKIDSTLTAAFDYGVVLATAAPKIGTENDALPPQTDALGADISTPAKHQGATASEQKWKDTQSSMEQVSGIDWSEKQFREKGEYWLVEMSGLYERTTINAAWRDLRTRFPKQTEKVSLFPRQQGRVDGANEERASWYRLYIATFPNSDLAKEVCASLRTSQLRCRVVPSDSLDKDNP
jgi:NodT family efflux transporter outer membrane factor (OMF) lipoprotein